MNTERILPKICELKRQIDFQAVGIGHTRTEYEQSRREQAQLHEELADRERALRESRVGSIQKLKELKREQECRLEEFSIRKLVEIYFKDVESVRSGQLFHVPIQPALFALHREPGGLRRIRDTHGISGNVCANPQASSSTTSSGMLSHMN